MEDVNAVVDGEGTVADGGSEADRVRLALEPGAVEMVFQPIVDLASGRLVGVEALARFQLKPHQPPDVWFAQAHAVGLGKELEIATASLAVASIGLLPEPLFMAVNLSPETIVHDGFLPAMGSAPLNRMILEVTEHAEVDDYDLLDERLRDLRGHGVRLAVDDAGAGFASLRHILRLAPDIIKLDISLTRDIHRDQARRALASALISFASGIGYTIVAEGIETDPELRTLRELGVSIGQGYYLAKPGPLPLPAFTMPSGGETPRI